MFFKKTPLITKQLDYTKPFVVLNLKTYKEASGYNALRLAKVAERVQSITGVNMIVCVQAIDIKEVASSIVVPVYAQHTDCNAPGKSTGSIVPEYLIDINVHGSMLNHSEKRLDIRVLQKSILRLKELDLKSIVCVKDDAEAKKVANFKPIRPDFISIEPPELIGGEISVSTAKPDIIKKAVFSCQEVPVLVGAGVKDNNDLRVALSLGAKGVLLASHFVLSKDPERFLLDLVHGLY